MHCVLTHLSAVWSGLGPQVTSDQIGWKVGATADGPQRSLGLSGPFSAPLFARQLSTVEAYTSLSLSGMGGLGVTVVSPLEQSAVACNYIMNTLLPYCVCSAGDGAGLHPAKRPARQGLRMRL